MKNTPLLLLATTTLFSTLAIADTSSDSHSLSISVPEVRLLHIKSNPGGVGGSENTNLLTFQKDAVEENNTPLTRSYSAKGYYDITANVEAGTSKTRSIMVSALGLDKNWKLSISSASMPRAFPKLVTLTNDIDTGELVSGVSNIAMRDIELSYRLESTSSASGSILDLPSEGIALTFTLTDDT